MYLELTRLSDNGIQTTGAMKLFDSFGNVLLRFDTLELSYKDNQRQISCIKKGVYVVKPHFSFRHGRCFALLAVKHRDNILIHKGNFNKDTKGCILIGNGFANIDFDDHLDLLNSRVSMANLLSTLTAPTTINITNVWESLTVKF